MRSPLLALTLILNLIPVSLCSQGVVRGRVTDNESGESLAGVYVIYGRSSGTSTDPDGYYSFRSDSTRVSITFQFIGYRTVTNTIIVKGNETLTLNIRLETETQEIDQVVVSADRMEQKVSELTVSIDVIRSDFVARNHITDAQELINKIPGIEVLDGQASIRGGSGFSYGVGSRVLALIDGLPMMAADGGNIKWNFMPFENLSQVEVIKGASSVLYGSSALNGIINFRTADASNIPVTRFYTEAGIFGKPKNKNWIWWSSPRIYSSASFSNLHKAGNTDIGVGLNLMTENSYRKYNDERSGRISLKLKHHSKKSDGLSYGLNLNAGKAYKTDFILWESAGSGALIQDTSSVSRYHSNYFSADPFVTVAGNDRIRHDVKMRLQLSENSFPVRAQNNSHSLSFYSEYHLLYRVTDIISLTAGLSGYYSIITSAFFGDHNGRNIAGFTQVELRPVPRLKLVAGIRLEQNALDGINDKVAPVFRTGLNFQAARYTFLRASFGQGYRYPSIAEKHAATTLGSVRIFPNPFVEPESGWSSEIGLKQGLMLGELNGQADLSLFYSRNNNMIEYIFGLYPGGLGFQAANVEQSRVYGCEIEFSLNRDFGDMNLKGQGGYTFIYPVEFNAFTNKNTGVFLKYRRKQSFKTGISAEYRKFETGLSVYASSKILNIDDVFVNPLSREMILPGFFDYWKVHNKGYFLADLHIGYIIYNYMTISLTVKNLTNTEYMGRPGDIQPHRNFSIRLSGKF